MMKMAALVLPVSIAVACSLTPSSTEQPTVQLGFGSAVPAPGSGGEVDTLVVTANDIAGDTVVAGLTVTLGTNATGIAFAPAAVTTNGSGTATASILIPWGSAVVATASSPDSGFATTTLAAPPAAIYVAPAPAPLMGGATTGELVALTVTATQPQAIAAGGSAGAECGSACIAGLTVSFATNVTGVAFAPPMVATNEYGSATSYVFVPYAAAPMIGTVSGGGATLAISLSQLLPQVALKLAPAATSYQPSGEVVTLAIAATAGSGAGAPAVAGLSIALATNVSTVVISPPTIVTDAGGNGSAQVFVPYGTTDVIATATGGGFTQTASLVEFPQSLMANAGSGELATVGATSGLVYPVYATVTDINGSGMPGIPVAFVQVGGGTNVFTPNPSVTNGSGVATSFVFVANVGSAANASPGTLVGLASVGSVLTGSGSSAPYLWDEFTAGGSGSGSGSG